MITAHLTHKHNQWKESSWNKDKLKGDDDGRTHFCETDVMEFAFQNDCNLVYFTFVENKTGIFPTVIVCDDWPCPYTHDRHIPG